MDPYSAVGWLLRKGIGCIYFFAFLIAYYQYVPLVGERGILPISRFLPYRSKELGPSLFFFFRSDRFLRFCAGVGVILSIAVITGITERFGFLLSLATWVVLWGLYQSFVHAGQVFYGYGWEILLLESGFLAFFLGSSQMPTPVVTVWLYRWVLFRLMFGSGLIKLRCDPGWKNLTCLLFHYETQPLPGPFSRFFHRFPPFLQKISVLFTYFVELIVPFFFFIEGPLAVSAGAITITFQLLLLIAGNYSWFNCLTIVLCFSCFSSLSSSIQAPGSRGELIYCCLTIVFACLVAYLSRKPVKNLCSRKQIMNGTFDRFALVNTYGAFGAMLRVRKEIVIEGCSDEVIGPESVWEAYEFKGKPGSVFRRPLQITPYHYKLDWQMWFAAMSSYSNHPWFLTFIERLLEGNTEVVSLLARNPFPTRPPRYIRAELYVYRFAPPGNPDSVFWVRERVGVYLPPVTLIGQERKVDVG